MRSSHYGLVLGRRLACWLACALVVAGCSFDESGLGGGALDAASATLDAPLRPGTGAVDGGGADAAPSLADAAAPGGDGQPDAAGPEPGDGVACGDATCAPGAECCVSRDFFGNLQLACVDEDACTGATALRCDGPEDCAGAGASCCTGFDPRAGTACSDAGCEVTVCHVDSDCPEVEQRCCDGRLGGYCARLCL